MAGKSLLPPPAGARIVTSYMKSGRTWLRFMLAHYLSDQLRLGIDVDLYSLFRIVPNNDDDPTRGRASFAFGDRPEVPLILCEHRLWAPFDSRANPTVVIVRAAVDTVVSAYFMASRHANRPDFPIGTYLRGPLGIAAWVQFHNGLDPDRTAPGVTWISYEQLTDRPAEVLGAVLDAFAIARDPARIARAVEASRFDRMAELEERQGFPGNPADPRDPQGRRMREGKVGGARDHLDPTDLAWARSALSQNLSPVVRDRLERLGCAM